ncbi:hypothetical protein DXT35_06295 [Enterococcus faecalis]|nr:hypothetical protein [Enterococcus faecalis]EGO5023682.1 hypothetical protein [Enterococcus faecalis]EGO7923765.1 hypothetical protein [Enterococcus faecalis]EGO8362681.1 hypothetical protein [Enterococcus faecalis]EGO8410230.1 hypothetical protein [Enterococcus faecalis]
MILHFTFGGLYMFRFIIGITAFILSFVGYGIYLRKKEVPRDFIPIIIFSSIIVAMFLGGLLNILKVMILIIIFSGIFLLLFDFWKNKSIRQSLKDLLSPGILFFLLFSFIFFLVSRNRLFMHYDNFSHWALIVKSMSLTNNFPNFKTDVIMFTSYPPGSAVFIYYFIKLVGVTESNAIFAQILLILASITTIFNWKNIFSTNFSQKQNKNVKKLLVFFLAVFSFYLFKGPTSLMDLLVDNLLLLLGTATMNIIFYYYHDFKRGLILSSPLMISLLLVKNSGVIFIGLNTIFLFISFWNCYVLGKERCTKKELFQFLLVLLTPWISFFLWLRHTKYVYPDGMSGKHDMSIAYYKKIFSEKSFSDIVEISKRFLLRMFSFTSSNFLYELLLFIIIALGIAFYLNKKTAIPIKTLKLQIISSLVLFLGYMCILWAMYLLSMPTPEALNLGSFDRYAGSIFNFLIAFIIVQLLCYIAKTDNYKIIMTSLLSLTLLFSCVIFVRISDYSSIFLSNRYPNSLREHIEQALPNSKNTLKDRDTSHSYAVYSPASKNDAGYSGFFLRYKLFNKKSSVIYDLNDSSTFNEKIKGKDYLVVVKDDPKILEYIKRNNLTKVENNTYKLH